MGNVTSYGYDAADRVTTVTDPRSKVTTYAYDVVGNRTQATDRLGRIVQYGYDADDRPTTETWRPIGGGAALRTVTTTYDFAGRVTSVQDPDSQYAYGYDDADRLTSVDNLGTPTLARVLLTSTYDDVGNRTGLADGLGGLTSYAYDVRDQLTQLTQSGTGVAAKRVDLAYDAAGRRTTLTRFSDLAGTTTVLETAYTYDAADRLTNLAHRTAGVTVRASYAYTLDKADRLTSETRTWGGGTTDTLAYTYTDDDQLTGVTHTNGSFANETFGYDANGNRNTTGYATATGNRTTSDGTNTYAYDDEGNLTSKTIIASGNQTLYTYDHRNRLTAADSVVGGVTTRIATYTYDALDRRIGVVAGGTSRWTLYDGASAILDFDGSGNETARYLQGEVIDEILARETGAGNTVAWYLPDRLGTIRDLVDNLGAVIDHVDYTVYGKVSGESAPANGDRWKFTGRELDAETGLQYHRARYYDAAIGRWTQEDPIGFVAGDANLYRYVGNQVADHTDPTGLDLKMGRTADGKPTNPRSRRNPRGRPIRTPDFSYFYVDMNIGGLPLVGPGGGCQVGMGPRGYWGIYPYAGIQSIDIGISIYPGQSVTPGWNIGASGGPFNAGWANCPTPNLNNWFLGLGLSPLPGAGIWYVWDTDGPRRGSNTSPSSGGYPPSYHGGAQQ